MVILVSVIPIIISVTASAFLTSSVSRRRMELQLENSTTTLHFLIDSLLKNSVRSYLRSKADAGLDLLSRALTDGADPDALADLLESFQVAGNGYFYLINTEGVVLYHPDTSFTGRNLRDTTPVKEQLQQREGYFEYLWRNSDEPEERKKALYMLPIPGRDWILAVTSYRDRFVHMVDLEALQDAVASVGFGDGGYSYVVDRDGSFVIHPYLAEDGASPVDQIIPPREYRAITEELFEKKGGTIRYMWRDRPEDALKRKMVSFKYLEDFDWVVGTAVYEADIGISVRWMVFINALAAFVIALLLSLIIRKLNRRVEDAILDISGVLDLYAKGDTSARVEKPGPSELGLLSKNLNIFLAELERSREELTNGIREREALLREIQHRVKNNLQLILSLLRLQQSEAKHPETLEALERSKNRIGSMALVYEYLSDHRKRLHADTVPFRWFLERYVPSILSASLFRHVQAEMNLSEVSLGRNRAIYCGLLVNELLTMLVRPGQSLEGRKVPDPVRITIILEQRGREVELSLQGSDGTFAPVQDRGQELLAVLVKQIGGLSVCEAPFREFGILFPGDGGGRGDGGDVSDLPMA